MTIYETIQNDKIRATENKSLIALLQSEICIDGKPTNDKKATAKLLQIFVTCGKTIKTLTIKGRTDAIPEEIVFMNLAEKYLPFTPLIASENDVELVLNDAGLEKSMKHMGRVMGSLKKCFHVVDGEMVKSVLDGGE